MQESVVKRELVQKKGISTVDILVAGILLAVGAVLRVFVPPMGFITPNFVIAMYCLVILLIKPRFLEVIGISLIAALLCQLTTKSAVPYINFISEPIGAIIAFVLVKLPFELKIGKAYSFKPFVVTFLGTVASGLSYVFAMKFVLFLNDAAGGKALSVMLVVVFVTAIANSVITQLTYLPIKLALKRD